MTPTPYYSDFPHQRCSSQTVTQRLNTYSTGSGGHCVRSQVSGLKGSFKFMLTVAMIQPFHLNSEQLPNADAPTDTRLIAGSNAGSALHITCAIAVIRHWYA